jgi:hypothetical protein
MSNWQIAFWSYWVIAGLAGAEIKWENYTREEQKTESVYGLLFVAILVGGLIIPSYLMKKFMCWIGINE